MTVVDETLDLAGLTSTPGKWLRIIVEDGKVFAQGTFNEEKTGRQFEGRMEISFLQGHYTLAELALALARVVPR